VNGLVFHNGEALCFVVSSSGYLRVHIYRYSRVVLEWWVQKFNMRKTLNDSDKDDKELV